jgi:hypothetical protein
MHRCTTYDVGGLRVDDQKRDAVGLTPQQLADKLGAEALEVTRGPFPHLILVWPEDSDIEPELWLHKERNAELAAGRWEKSA